MPRINLDERRAQHEPTEIEANGRTYTLASGMPASVIVDLAGLAMTDVDPERAIQGLRDAYTALFGEKDAPAAMRDIHLNELGVLIKEIYGVSVGESLASPKSSPNGGSPSRPTSNGSTRSTSTARSGGRRR